MRSFKYTITNPQPFSGLDSTVIFGDGTDPTYKILLQSADGLGYPDYDIQTQRSPFQSGESLIRTQFKPRFVTLNCAINVWGNKATAVTVRDTIKRTLGQDLAPAGSGFQPNTSLLTSAYSTYTGRLAYASDGVTYDRFIDCIPAKVEMPNKLYNQWQLLRVTFFCPDPTWYGAVQTATMSAVVGYGSTRQWKGTAYSPSLGLFVMAETGGDWYRTSTDGISWTTYSTVGTAPASEEIAWSPSAKIFVSASMQSSRNIMSSSDGITWTTRLSGIGTFGAHSVCWSDDLSLFVAGFDAAIYTSPDGITWTVRTLAAGALIVRWSSELQLFVAISYTGTPTFYTSPTGTTWTSRTTPSGGWGCLVWSPALGLWVAGAMSGTNFLATSPDGITWTGVVNGSKQMATIVWADSIGLLIAGNAGGSCWTSPDGTIWTARTVATGIFPGCWASSIGTFIAASQGAYLPTISYDGVNYYNPTTSDFVQQITNSGDVPTEFLISIPIAGGETGKVVVISDNFIWDGTGTPPSDHNLVVKTDGLKKGNVIINMKFGSKSIKQFGVSKMNSFSAGTFFSLYVTGIYTNNIYFRNTGTASGAPTITWKNRYLAV